MVGTEARDQKGYKKEMTMREAEKKRGKEYMGHQENRKIGEGACDTGSYRETEEKRAEWVEEGKMLTGKTHDRLLQIGEGSFSPGLTDPNFKPSIFCLPLTLPKVEVER